MSRRPPLFDEGLAGLRGDALLRTLAERDSLEPSRGLDRAVLASARAAAQAARVAAPRRRLRAGPALRWGIPTALAAAAVCTLGVHRTASRPGAPHVADERFLVERMQPPQSNTLEMVRVSAHYRGAGPRVAAPTVSAYLAPSGAGVSNGFLIPSLFEVSAPMLSIRTAPPHKRGSEEQTPRAATRSSERASRSEREWAARRRVRPPWLIDSVDSLEVRLSPPPPRALEVVGSSGASARVRNARVQAAPAGPP